MMGLSRCFALSLAWLLCFVGAEASVAESRPNVLFILTDDQGYGDLSLHGNPVLKTPHLDKLGREGIRLEQFYVNALCSPTRASLLTGRYHMRTGVTDVTRRREVLNPAETTLGELFGQNGYRTGYFGKWHNGSVFPETPDGQGFDEFIGFPYGHTTLYFDPVLHHNDVKQQRKGYITDILTGDAIAFMESAQADAVPFFCFVSYNAPHTPIMVPAHLLEAYKHKGLSDREAGIYAMIESLDQSVGRLLAWLDQAGLTNNTMVVFLTDNGPAFHRFNAGMKGKKASHHEGGVRVPCFWRWPAKWKAPAVVNQRLMHIDVLPTLAELCGLEETGVMELDGKSFSALLCDPQATWPDRTLYMFASGADRIAQVGSVRTARWLAVKQWGPWELYDLQADPGEENNLAARYPDVLQELQSGFDDKMGEFVFDLHRPTPIPVGNPLRPSALLEAHDATLYPANGEGITYSYHAGFAHHWITNWTDAEAYPEWLVNVLTPGDYKVVLSYGLKPEDAGVHLRLSTDLEEIPFVLTDPYVPPAIQQPFIIPQEAAKYATHVWTKRVLGTLHMKPGVQSIRLHADIFTGQRALDLKSIELRLVQ